MKRLPSAVRLLTTRIRVEKVAHIDISDSHGAGAEALGLYESDSNLIVMAQGQPADRERTTFLHENLHAMWDYAGLDRDQDFGVEEEFISRLSPVLLSWLRENRGVVAYLQERS